MFRRKVAAVKEEQMFGFGEEKVKPEPYHPFTEEAQMLLKKRQYNTALKYLDISLEFTPDNPLTLANKSGRAKSPLVGKFKVCFQCSQLGYQTQVHESELSCLINLFEPEEAMPSAARSLVEYKRYVEEELDGRQETVLRLGTAQEGRESLPPNRVRAGLDLLSQGSKAAAKHGTISQGDQESQESYPKCDRDGRLVNKLGTRSERVDRLVNKLGTRSERVDRLVNKLGTRSENSQTHFEDIIGLLPKICTVSEIISNRQGFPKFQPCTALSPLRRDEIIKEVLGPLRKDAKFVNNIKKDHTHIKPLDDELRLQTKAGEIQQFLNSRQEFWCKQNPLYSRFRVKSEKDAKMAAEESTLRKIRQEEFELKKEDCMRHVAEWKEMIEAALKENDWDSVIELNLELEEYIKS
uniref:Uncharacterized protein n=1 Tax=Timema cristinae TaxID=61476 RepID=A0A7R9H2I2_TIMCR|nr:unnamed protein product [Timema cristinae]